METYQFIVSASKYDATTKNYEPISTTSKTVHPENLNGQWKTLSNEQKEQWLDNEVNRYVDFIGQEVRGVVLDGTWVKVPNT